jgi:peptidoglycan/xylan/chitin deacetylase (PgdA/CDA1 family)
MMKGLDQMRYKLVGWSWMSWDWVGFRKRTPERVARQLIGNAKPGKIMVVHDGHHIDPRPDRQYAIGAAELVIDALQSEGYEFAPLCEAGP